ncbi:MAG: 5'-3' exonuclease, partial [Planctomycetota bacterium]
MPELLFLIDGHSLIYQSFYALPGLSAPDGRPTGAVFGFLRVLDKVLREQKPTHLAVVLDAPGPTFRHERYKEYKATRKPMPEELRGQIPILLNVLEAREVPILRVGGVEADDVLGTLARAAAERGACVRIVSRDKDLKQLLGPHVALFDPKTDALFEVDALEKDTGLKPEQFPDFLGLAGDTSDNIPGVPGVGQKTALTLLKEFGSLEAVLEGWDKIRGAKRKAAVRDHADQARLSRELAVIKTDVPLTETLDDFVVREGDRPALEAHYVELGFTSLLTAEAEGAGKRVYKKVTNR